MLERMQSKRNTPPLLVEVQTCTTTLEISVIFSQRIENQFTSRQSNTTLGYIPTGCIPIPQRHLFNYVHSNNICNSQNLETTLMPLNWRRVNENVVHLHNGILLSSKKQHLEIFRQMNGTRKKNILSEVTQTQKNKHGMYSLLSRY